MKKVLKIALMTGLMTFGISLASTAQEVSCPMSSKKCCQKKYESCCKKGKHKQDLAERLKNELGLNNDQVMQIQAIDAKYEQQMQPLSIQMMQLHRELQTLQSTYPITTMDPIYAQIDAISALRNQMMKLAAGQVQEIRTVLTPEQRAKFDTMHQEKSKYIMREDKRCGPIPPPSK